MCGGNAQFNEFILLSTNSCIDIVGLLSLPWMMLRLCCQIVTKS